MLIYAHRGASAEYPEMSRIAYLAAVEEGADGFECDLRLTRDRVLICWHDKNLQRIAGSALIIAKSTLAELQAVTEILTFDELLTIALDHKKNLALESKHPVPTGGAVEYALLKALDARADLIVASGINIAIMSFSWWAVLRIRSSHYLAVYLIAHRWQRFITITQAIGPGIFLVRNDAELGARLTRKNRQLFIWTVNTRKDLIAAMQAGADVVMSDRPGEMKKILSTIPG